MKPLLHRTLVIVAAGSLLGTAMAQTSMRSDSQLRSDSASKSLNSDVPKPAAAPTAPATPAATPVAVTPTVTRHVAGQLLQQEPNAGAVVAVPADTKQAVTVTAPAAPATPAPVPVPSVTPVAVQAAPTVADTATALPPVPQAATPIVPDDEAVPAGEDGRFSFGDAPYSVLFTSNQIDAMKKSLRAFETIRRSNNAGDVLVTEELPIAAPQIVEPATYPSFYLSSIVYRTANDWTVWLNNTRITPKTNDGEVKVTLIKPDRAWFNWRPTYMEAVQERNRRKLYAASDAVHHRLARPATVSFNKTGGVDFSLKPNQSFVGGYFDTFEGKVDSPALQPINPPQGANGAPLSAADAATVSGLLDNGGGSMTPEQQTMDQLISNQRPASPTPAAAAVPTQ